MSINVTSIIITYNHEKYISECIESILNQKVNFNHYIYISDDSSTDNTAKICEAYHKKYPDKIILNVNKKNIGPTYNYFNAISKNTHNNYIAYCDGDDYWCDENKLQKQINALEKNNDCSFSAHDSYFMDGSLVRQELLTNVYKRENFNILTHTSSRVIRCKDIKNILPNDTGDSIFQAYLLFSGNVFYFNERMSVYRPIGGAWSGLSTLEKERAIIEGREYLERLKERFIKK